MGKTVTEDLEHRIIEAARELFIDKGYAETSMSDIAAQVGISRTNIHYYYRTKDKMFQTVFGSIVEQLVPRVLDNIKRNELSVYDRTCMVIDTYYDVFTQNPKLPFFLIREINRDFGFVRDNIISMGFDQYFEAIRTELQNQMDNGQIRKVQMRKLFFTFYSMLTFPFVVKPMCEYAVCNDDETFQAMLGSCRDHIATVMSSILTV